MSLPISSIINLSISLQTQAVTRAGFGVPLILTNETPSSSWGSELVRTYTSVDEVLDDWTSSDEVYLAAVSALSQTPRITSLKVGLEQTRVAQQTTIVFSGDFVASNEISSFTLSAGGTVDTISATSFTSDNPTTLAAITAKIHALSGYTAADDGNNTITVTSATAGLSFSISAITVTGGASQPTATITDTVDNVGPAESIAAIKDQDDDWYGLVWIERGVGLVYEMATFIETQRKLFGTVSQASGTLSAASTTDIAYLLSAANFNRTFGAYNADATDYLDSGIMGRVFPYDPGSITWNFKTVSGITADNLTSSQITALENKDFNMYVTAGGVDIFRTGVCVSGEYIDIIRGADWLQARIEEAIYQQLVNLPKIPFTNKGIAIIENILRAQLENAIRVGFLSGDPLDPNSNDENRKTKPYIISAPLSSEVSSSDKANRSYTGVTFEAKAAGAIHTVTIAGVVTV